MLAQRFQKALPESMFVLPVREGTPLPAGLPQVRRVPDQAVLDCPQRRSARNRDRWIDEWTQAVLR